MKNLDAKLVLITGAARGIGLALARRFAAEGAEVLISDLDEAALADAIEKIAQDGGRARAYALDVTDATAIAATRKRILEECGPIDLLVNNAGTVFGGPFLDVDIDRHRSTFEINLIAPVMMTHAFLPDLLSRPEAHIVNIASASGLIGIPFGASYASSKWGLIGWSESLRLEMKHWGKPHLGVTTVCPSYVSTGLFEGAKPPLLTKMLTPERLAEITVRAVGRKKAFVLAPWLVRITPFLKGVLPRPIFEKISELTGATTSMQHVTPHGGAKISGRD